MNHKHEPTRGAMTYGLISALREASQVFYEKRQISSFEDQVEVFLTATNALPLSRSEKLTTVVSLLSKSLGWSFVSRIEENILAHESESEHIGTFAVWIQFGHECLSNSSLTDERWLEISEDILNLIDRALVLNPRSAALLYDIGAICLERSDKVPSVEDSLNAAIQALKRAQSFAIHKDEENLRVQIVFMTGVCYFKLHNFDEAYKLLSAIDVKQLRDANETESADRIELMLQLCKDVHANSD